MSIIGRQMTKTCIANEPPGFNARFTVIPDARGRWIVADSRGLIGGLFRDRDAAIHFARSESDPVPKADRKTPAGVRSVGTAA
jgi:hypothetical protein